nr:MAG TPA: hypothetical protein [Caudoviricetes sp.]
MKINIKLLGFHSSFIKYVHCYLVSTCMANILHIQYANKCLKMKTSILGVIYTRSSYTTNK